MPFCRLMSIQNLSKSLAFIFIPTYKGLKGLTCYYSHGRERSPSPYTPCVSGFP